MIPCLFCYYWPMQKVQLGKTELYISPIVFGAWAIGGQAWGGNDDKDALEAIKKGFDLGLTSIDTAPVYGKGQSEQLLGQQLPKNQNIIISTKSFIKPLNSIEKSLNNSLNRLRRDYVDFFFIHWPSTKEDCRPVVELLERFRAQGKIKNIGLSNFNLEYLKLAQQAGKIDIIQNAYNFFWSKEIEFIKSCQNQGIITQIYSPLAQGLLTGKFTKENPYIKSDLRYKMNLFNDENLKVAYKYIPKLQKIADRNSTTLHNLVLKWLEHIEYIDSIVVGCRKRYQIEALVPLKNLIRDKIIIFIL